MTDYQHKPGRGSLFRNDRKQSSNQPDYRGDICLPDGSSAWLSGWKETSKSGTSYLSVSIQIKEEQPQQVAGDSNPHEVYAGNDSFADLESDVDF